MEPRSLHYYAISIKGVIKNRQYRYCYPYPGRSFVIDLQIIETLFFTDKQKQRSSVVLGLWLIEKIDIPLSTERNTESAISVPCIGCNRSSLG
jgi:hypothetical protein